jgi:hypothetical protein
VVADQKTAQAQHPALGQAVDLGDGITAVVTGYHVGGDESGPWLEVNVRAENHGAKNATNPEAAIVCAGSADSGGWQAAST